MRRTEKLAKLLGTLEVIFHQVEQTRGGNTDNLRAKRVHKMKQKTWMGQAEIEESESKEEIGDDDDDDIADPPQFEP